VSEPLKVVVTWDDACSRPYGASWDGTFETAAKIAEVAPLYVGRQTIGWLVLVDERALWLAHDYDAEENGGEVSSFAVIPIGWITSIKTLRGKTIYERDVRTPRVRAASGRARSPK